MTDDLVKRLTNPMVPYDPEVCAQGFWEDLCGDAKARIEALTAQLAEDKDARALIDHRLEELVAQVDALTAERAGLIRDRDRWAEEAQANTSPIVAGLMAVVAGLMAEVDRLKAKVARQSEQITGLEASRRKLESLTAGAHRRVADVEAERDRLWGALNDLVTFLEGTGFTTRFCDAARAALKGQQP